MEQIRPEPEPEAIPERREEDLRGHLDNERFAIEEEEAPSTEEAQDDPTDGDYQLARAIEHLRGHYLLSGVSADN